jgi:hypothetical protein
MTGVSFTHPGKVRFPALESASAHISAQSQKLDSKLAKDRYQPTCWRELRVSMLGKCVGSVAAFSFPWERKKLRHTIGSGYNRLSG